MPNACRNSRQAKLAHFMSSLLRSSTAQFGLTISNMTAQYVASLSSSADKYKDSQAKEASAGPCVAALPALDQT